MFAIPGVTWQHISFEPTRDPALAPFTESLDVMGDGSLVLLPTPGHTPGSIALLVRRPGKASLLLVGDLSYEAGLLARSQLPGVGNRRRLAGPPTRCSRSPDSCRASWSCRLMIRPRPRGWSRHDPVQEHDHDLARAGSGVRLPSRFREPGYQSGIWPCTTAAPLMTRDDVVDGQIRPPSPPTSRRTARLIAQASAPDRRTDYSTHLGPAGLVATSACLRGLLRHAGAGFRLRVCPCPGPPSGRAPASR